MVKGVSNSCDYLCFLVLSWWGNQSDFVGERLGLCWSLSGQIRCKVGPKLTQDAPPCWAKAASKYATYWDDEVFHKDLSKDYCYVKTTECSVEGCTNITTILQNVFIWMRDA
jgi:hypothetical protein